jgi:hypothetical protein
MSANQSEVRRLFDEAQNSAVPLIGVHGAEDLLALLAPDDLAETTARLRQEYWQDLSEDERLHGNIALLVLERYLRALQMLLDRFHLEPQMSSLSGFILAAQVAHCG